MIFWKSHCFFSDPTDVGNLIPGSSAFSKSSLNIRNFSVCVLLTPGLENFEHYFTSVWDECSCAVVWAFFGVAFLWDWNENWPFPVLWPLLSFPNLLACWVQHFHSIIFQDLKWLNWNSITSTILFIVILSKAHLTLHSRMSGCRSVITPSWLSRLWRSFLYSSFVYSCHLFLISSASVRLHIKITWALMFVKAPKMILVCRANKLDYPIGINWYSHTHCEDIEKYFQWSW